MVVRCPGAVFHLRWSTSNLAAAPHILHNYRQNLASLDEAVDGKLRLLALDRLQQPFTTLMTQLKPQLPVQTHFVLHDYLYSRSFYLEAKLTEDNQAVKPTLVRELDILPGEPLCSKQLIDLDIDGWALRGYSSRDIELPARKDRHPLLSIPSRVTIAHSGAQYFFKGFGPGGRGNVRELAIYRAIDKVDGELSPRICRLHGLVVDHDSESGPRLIGMLLVYIKAKRPGILGTLYCVAQDRESLKHLPRWADELESMVIGLHESGLGWGDASPTNVLVDKDDNLWLVDFGGGFTNGWVDEDLESTQAGDQQALGRIRNWFEELIAGQ
ncbi:uncharacterized protein B0I36DRAFT_250792 [Microdochium trichocladiopsis]|uniref:Protein kinase domain-containing protein n=1 Tax=Microdochium trichocladiopsis TaxID=1682393 RepID=A0A9P9BKW4_9PEZI|nr:uncharacterized protein B0I36DRAFT_250792 [Microdochium trichocladiopsis]KAH7024327.1 hypothetical protein B0I36DRAFT_250792 [Microdochium trichocladiopsis]